MSINVLKKTLSAERYVKDLALAMLNLPYRAEREARSDIDFSNYRDVLRYRSTVEAIVWANVQTAGHIIDVCLGLPGLIDDDSKEWLWRRLQESAETLIRDGLARTEEDGEDKADGPLHKSPCDICNKPGGMFKVKHHSVCARCLEEVVQIVFSRVTDTEEQGKCLCDVQMKLLENEIRRLTDYRQTWQIADFLNLMVGEPSSLDWNLRQQLLQLKKIASDRSEQL